MTLLVKYFVNIPWLGSIGLRFIISLSAWSSSVTAGAHDNQREQAGEDKSVKSAGKVSDIKLGGQANEVKCSSTSN